MAESNDQFVDAIRDLIPINGLPEQHQDEVLQRGRVVKFRKGRYVFKQGDKDNFSFYLIEGELELIADGQLVKQVSAGTADARHALAQLQPRQLSARAKTPLHVFKIDRMMLDRLLADDRFDDTASLVEVAELSDDPGGDWMTRMLGSDLFSRLPAANIQTIFTRMEAVDANAGDVVVEQGSPGDYYYIIQTGRCLVTRRSPANGDVVKLAELKQGDSFGEEALVSDSRRNATVTMLTDGQLMRLAKTDFNELIKKPTLSSVTYAQATKLAEQGAVWLDVRFADEHKATGIKGSRNLPLNSLRAKMAGLDPDKRYVVYCDSGGRSSAGAFLLAQRGYDASYLAGGLIHSPIGVARPDQGRPAARTADADAKPASAPAARGNGQAGPPAMMRPSSPAPAARAPSPAPSAAPHPGGGAVSREELATLKRQLDEALRLKIEAQAARADLESAMEMRIKAERDRVQAEAARANVAIKESQRLKREILEARKQVEAANNGRPSNGAADDGERRVLEQRHIEAERRLREEKQRLESALKETARELEVVARKRDEAEARLREEKQALEARSRESERRLREAEQLKREAESARRAAGERKDEQAEREIREQREALRRESEEASRRLAEAKRREEEIEVARREAGMSVERKREELRSLEERLRADEKNLMQRVKQTMAEERRRLESELADSREALARAQAMARQAAEEERRAAEKEAERIIAEYKQAHEMVLADELAKLQSERAQLEAEAERAKRTLAEAQRLRRDAEQSRRDAERQIAELRAAKDKAGREQSRLLAKVDTLEAQVQRANHELRATERMSQVAQAAHDATTAELERQREEERRLQAELENERDRVLNPRKIAELQRQRDALERAAHGRRK